MGNKRYNLKMNLIQKKCFKFLSHEVKVLCFFHILKITCGFCYVIHVLRATEFPLLVFFHSHFCSCIPNRQLCINIKCNLQIRLTTKTIQCSRCTQTCCYVHFLYNRKWVCKGSLSTNDNNICLTKHEEIHF
jgi:hypothetical protein